MTTKIPFESAEDYKSILDEILQIYTNKDSLFFLDESMLSLLDKSTLKKISNRSHPYLAWLNKQAGYKNALSRLNSLGIIKLFNDSTEQREKTESEILPNKAILDLSIAAALIIYEACTIDELYCFYDAKKIYKIIETTNSLLKQIENYQMVLKYITDNEDSEIQNLPKLLGKISHKDFFTNLKMFPSNRSMWIERAFIFAFYNTWKDFGMCSVKTLLSTKGQKKYIYCRPPAIAMADLCTLITTTPVSISFIKKCYSEFESNIYID